MINTPFTFAIAKLNNPFILILTQQGEEQRMASIRLNEGDRSFLYGLAKERVACPAEEAADKAAYAKAEAVVRKIVETKYPPKDMKLLVKYEVAAPDRCIRLQLAAGGVVEFTFPDEKAAPLTPGRRGYGCSSRMYLADEAATPIIAASLQAKDALKKARGRKLEDYKALIWASTSLEQVEAVWPAAAALRPRKGRALPVVLSDEVIARIKADIPLAKAA